MTALALDEFKPKVPAVSGNIFCLGLARERKSRFSSDKDVRDAARSYHDAKDNYGYSGSYSEYKASAFADGDYEVAQSANRQGARLGVPQNPQARDIREQARALENEIDNIRTGLGLPRESRLHSNQPNPSLEALRILRAERDDL